MKICFDAFPLTHLPNTGLYTYSYELIKNLLNYYPQPNYCLITNNDGIKMPFDNKKGLSFKYADINRVRNDYSLISEYLQGNKIRLYHSVNNGFSIPEDKVCKYVTTIHDTIALSDKSLVDPKYVTRFNKVVPKALDKSDKIIAVSNFVKGELLKYSNIPAEKVEVIYPIVSKQFKPIWAVHYRKVLMKKYNLTGDFILSVGSLHKRKNLSTVLAILREILTEERNIKLVIIGDTQGKRNPYFLQLQKQAQNLGISENVMFLGTVDYEDIPYFYNEAKCLVNLSSYEGFPTSAMEAKACEAPVVCTMNSSFREVLGDYPIYVESEDTHNIAAEVLQLIYRKESPMLFRNKDTRNEDSDLEPIKKIIKIYESLMYAW